MGTSDDDSRYAVEINRIYNCFDAWVAVEVDLYARDDGWTLIDDREFDVSVSRTIGLARADRLARKWMTEYDAIRL